MVGRRAAAWADDAGIGGTCLVQGVGRGLAERVGRWKGWDDAAGNGLNTARRQAQNERFLVAEPHMGSSLASRVRCAVCALPRTADVAVRRRKQHLWKSTLASLAFEYCVRLCATCRIW